MVNGKGIVRKRLNNVDLAWLRLDYPENQLIITGLMTLAAPVEYERLRSRMIEMLTPFNRFQQRLVQPGRLFQRAYWETDAAFNFDNHLEMVDLPEPGDQQTLEKYISQLLSKPLDPHLPLWHVYFIPRFNGGSAVIARIHHTITDGISLMQIISTALDEEPDPKHPSSSIGRKLMERAKRKRGLGTRQKVKAFFSRSEYAGGQIRGWIKFLELTFKLLFLPADPPTPLKGPLGIEKRAVWSQPLEMEHIRKIGRQYGSTINDVLTAVIAGSLSRYLTFHGFDTHDLTIRSIVLVNLRPLELDEELGNKFGFYFVELPLWVDNGMERLKIIKNGMDSLKNSPFANVTFQIFRLTGSLPASLEKAVMRFFDTKATLIITNVPGYKHQLYLAGSPMETITTMVPHSSRIGLGFSMVSYNEHVILGITSDAGLVPDPDLMLAFFCNELEAMAAQSDLESV